VSRRVCSVVHECISRDGLLTAVGPDSCSAAWIRAVLSHNGCRLSSTILELDCRQSIPTQNSLEQPEKDGQTTVNCNFDEEDGIRGMSTHI
jgi:hypothetical protein